MCQLWGASFSWRVMDESARIDEIAVRELVLPLVRPFRISGGAMSERRSIIVEMRSGGATGYGESAPFVEPFYSEETVATVRSLYHDLYLPRLVGRRFDSIESFDEALRRGVRGNPFARAGLENAYWDLLCARNGCSLVEAIRQKLERLGLSREQLQYRDQIPCGVAVGIPDDEEPATLRRWIEDYLQEGYRRVKIKIRPGWDVEACRAAREVCGERIPVWTDANASFRLEEDLDLFRRLDDLNLLFHEQPLHHRDLLDHSKLGREIRTPICLDESLTSARVAQQALELEASRIWNVKVQRVGGLREAIEIYAIAVRSGVKLWGGTMPESGIGAQPIIALAAYPAFVFPADVEPSARWYAPGHDPVELTMTSRGKIPLSRAPGTGGLIDRDRYKRFSRLVETLKG